MQETQINFSSPVRHIEARVELYNGSTLENTFRYDDKLKTIEIQRVGEQTKFFGYTICQRLNYHILDVNREIDITTNHSMRVYIGDVTFPTFYVSEVHRDENTNELSITAYDLMKQATAHKTSELTLTPPYTTKQFIDACASLLGTTAKLYEDDFFNTSYPEGINIEGTENIRDVLNAACEATLSIAFINKNDKLRFKRLTADNEVDLPITKEDYIKLTSGDNRRLVEIVSATELGDNVSAKTSLTGTTQYVRNNPFWELREDIDAILNRAIGIVGNLTINKFDCSWRGNPALNIGDKITLQTKDNETVTAFVLDDVITYDGGLEQRTQFDFEDQEETDRNSSNLGDALKMTFARVDKANKEIAIQAQEIQSNAEDIAQLNITTENITAQVSSTNTRIDNLENTMDETIDNKVDEATQEINDDLAEYKRITEENIAALVAKDDEIVGSVQRVQETQTETINGVITDVETLRNTVETKVTADAVTIQINEALSNGVTSVDTGTGFTFNQEGLTIAKTDSEMTTNIDEDGMSVYRNDEEVLTADNTGVNAINLTARQYLIIGKNSRFEDYNDVRTACFYIGQQGG